MTKHGSYLDRFVAGNFICHCMVGILADQRSNNSVCGGGGGAF